MKSLSVSARVCRLLAVGPVVLLAICAMTCTVAADGKPTPQAIGVSKVVNVAWHVSDAILERHIDPAARQQMLLRGLQHAAKAAQTPIDPKWAQLLSQANERQLRQAVSRLLQPAARKLAPGDLESHFVRGMLSCIKGGGHLVPGDAYRVQRQLAQNQYVGLGVQLAGGKKWHAFVKVFPRSPARRAGVRDGDLILEVDGESTAGQSTSGVVKMLRGLRGSEVTIVVRQPKEKKPRKYTIVRDVVPIDTVVGTKRVDDSTWDFAMADSRFAMVSFRNVNGSTAAEWKLTARRIARQSFDGITLDFRETNQADFHQTVLLADAMLDSEDLGDVVRIGAKQSFRTGAGATLPTLPIVVLLSQRTPDSLRWLANALKTHRHAKLLGPTNKNIMLRRETIELPEQSGAVILLTGVLVGPGEEAKLEAVPTPPQVTKIKLLNPKHVVNKLQIMRNLKMPSNKDASQALDSILKKRSQKN